MQTQFSLAQLADPDIKAADGILRACVHCGFCTATCPTYVIDGDELDSPRGRIYLIKNMLESGNKADAVVARHVDRCLTCLGCMTTCPSGVDYLHLVDLARERIEREFARPLGERWLRRLIAWVLPRPGLFRLALRGGGLVRRLALDRLMPGRLRSMLALVPNDLPAPAATDFPGIFKPEGRRKGRVALLSGCAQPVLRPEINAAAIRLLNRLGIEVVLAADIGCCGALVQHMGRADEARVAARRAIGAWCREMDGDGLDAILVTASGCGSAIKDYGHLFRDHGTRADAERVAARTRDISEYLVERGGVNAAGTRANLKVAYHSACSLQHGQGVREAPQSLLRQAGFDVLEVPEGHLCCGSAGTYNMLQPERADELRTRKIANVDRTQADVVAAGNIGCLQQLAGGTAAPVVHTIELLDWAMGGPLPKALDKRVRTG